MFLEKIVLTDFKNYTHLVINPNSKINCLIGKNGVGKTNLLDAIYYLCFTKSAINSLDNQNIKHGSTLASINGVFQTSEASLKVTCALQEKQKKLIKINGEELKKISSHVGSIPLVFISPDDTLIIREGSEVRRKFLDVTLSQISPTYLDDLMQYNHLLKQRNNLLKNWPDGKTPDLDLFESYDVKLIPLSQAIHGQRKKFIERFRAPFATHYEFVSDDKEKVDVTYISQLNNENYELEYKKSLKRDVILQRTNMGIHKDDFQLEMNGMPVKKFASQGQQKSVVIALKLAQFDIIKEEKGITPLLLLDDIFDKLDDNRIEKLVNLMDQDNFGQIFITDARPERSKSLMHEFGEKVTFFEIEEGAVKE